MKSYPHAVVLEQLGGHIFQQNGIFFITSYGKILCDAIGGTVKQLAASHSLKATSEGHIVTPFEFHDYDWTKNNIAVIRFLYVEKDAADLLKPGQDVKFFKV